ncbi:hypothetical protein OMK64_12660, partial [Cellulomonas fimi]|uniref:hypothetical protein n=1 Tax=Cellulomonas fimi TaxID=1708 RepID=UPI00234D85C2
MTDWPPVAEPGTPAARAILAQRRNGTNDPALARNLRAVPVVREERTATQHEAPAPDPGDWWSTRPLLAEVRALAYATMTAPSALLGVILARVLAAVPPTLVLPPIVVADASLNLYVAVVGASGAGKGGAGAVADARVRIVGGRGFDRWPLGSGEGIARAYVRRTKARDGHTDQYVYQTNVLFETQEVDTLGALSSRQGATLSGELRQAWSGERLGFGYADPDKRLTVPAHAYRLVLVVGVQPGRAGALLNETDGGTPQRFVWVTATDPTLPDRPTSLPEDYRLTITLPRIDGRTRQRMDVCAEACDTIRDARAAQMRGASDALDGHALLARLKVAAALALADTRLDVTAEDWHLAG